MTAFLQLLSYPLLAMLARPYWDDGVLMTVLNIPLYCLPFLAGL